MFGFSPPEEVAFLCAPEDLGVIAPPVPARDVLPDWFRKLPPVDKSRLSTSDNGLTVKRCMPFWDAMGTGWIIPLAASVRLDIKDQGRTVDAGWEFDKTMVSNHHAYQVQGHPAQPSPPCKFHNHWTVKTPPGWSCLFVSPLNRPNGIFEVAAGVVDTDTYTAPVHFPFFVTAPDGLHTLDRGMPLVQVIPFKRQNTAIPGVVRAETPTEAQTRTRIQRATMAADGWYRQEARAKR